MKDQEPTMRLRGYSVCTNTGHNAGPAGGRWDLRAIVKRRAKKRRRQQDKRESGRL